ncbi:MAG TPA: hypothetical protein PKO19_08070, partial [Chitinophagales bacterium]|nr:hypothetical protein [Chitinophagales bacterium]
MKIILNCFFLICITSVGYSQTFEKVYEKRYFFACESLDNSYLLVGEDPVDDTLDNISLLRISAINGNVQSEYIYSLEGFDLFPNFVIETDDGGAYICAILRYDNLHGDPIIIKIDACGNPLWMRNLNEIFCPYLGLSYLNEVNYATLDGNGGLTFVIGLECVSFYCFNIDQYGIVRWVSNAIGEESWMMSGTNFRRMDDGKYVLTGYQHTYWSDTVLYSSEYKINAAIRILDSIGNFVDEEEYMLDSFESMAYGICDSWVSGQYVGTCHTGVEHYTILAVSNELDSISHYEVASMYDYVLLPLDIYQGPKGQYYIIGNSCDTIPLLHSGLGAQLIDSYGNVLAQNSTGFDINYGYRNSFVTSDLNVVILADVRDDSETAESEFDLDTYLISFDQDLNISLITDTVTPVSAISEACGYETATVHFDLSPIMEEGL